MAETLPCEDCLIAVYCICDVSGRCLRRELEGGAYDKKRIVPAILAESGN